MNTENREIINYSFIVAWFDVNEMSRKQNQRFFSVDIILGPDMRLWQLQSISLIWIALNMMTEEFLLHFQYNQSIFLNKMHGTKILINRAAVRHLPFLQHDGISLRSMWIRSLVNNIYIYIPDSMSGPWEFVHGTAIFALVFCCCIRSISLLFVQHVKR